MDYMSHRGEGGLLRGRGSNAVTPPPMSNLEPPLRPLQALKLHLHISFSCINTDLLCYSKGCNVVPWYIFALIMGKITRSGIIHKCIAMCVADYSEACHELKNVW